MLMLAAAAFMAVAALFLGAPNISMFKSQVIESAQTQLQASQFEISDLKLAWQAGPALDLGNVQLQTSTYQLQNAHILLSYPLMHIFRGSLAPQVIISGGAFFLDLDKAAHEKPQASHVRTVFEAVDVSYVLQQQRQDIPQLSLELLPQESEFIVHAAGLDAYIAFDELKHLQQLRVEITDFSCLPNSWMQYAKNLTKAKVNVQNTADASWKWNVDVLADKGSLDIPQAHFLLPFQRLQADGSVVWQDVENKTLAWFEASSLHWKDDENFADLSMLWKQDNLHIDVHAGSASMPMLWSWLWMLGGDSWHAWLSSMHQGRIDTVTAVVDLPWSLPLQQAPSHQNLLDMTYHVNAKASGADIALGLEGDYLTAMHADVEVDSTQLQAKISSTLLDNGAGEISGEYSIDWENLMMQIQGQGMVDVGKLHNWLDKDSGQEMHWGKAPASATVNMRWSLKASGPEHTLVKVKPTADWILAPKGIDLVAHQGLATWDINRGLDLSDMQMTSPWFKGEVSLYLNKNKQWALENFELDAKASLKTLTDSFALPIEKPSGETALSLKLASGFWIGDLDMANAHWQNFLGEQRKGTEPMHIVFSGKPKGGVGDILPIQLSNIRLMGDTLDITGHAHITANSLDLNFEEIYSPAFVGKLRLFLPMHQELPIGLEVVADYVDRPLLTSYMQMKESNNTDAAGQNSPMPRLSLYADVRWMQWERSHAENFKVRFSSDDNSNGSISAELFDSGDLELENLDVSFSLLKQDQVDLHRFVAEGSGQKITISGSVHKLNPTEFQWQGLVVMGGEFGQLMAQAELNKLFNEGKMNAVFLGKGTFKEGEAWWRGLDGHLRLRVDEGRINQGGTLTRLLAAISLVDLPKYLIFQRQDVVGKGLFYDKMQVEADFKEEKLTIKQLAFLSSALDAGGTGEVNLDTGHMDLVIIGRPWQNIEAVVGSIPLLGYVLTGKDKSLLRKVYRIHGPASDAQVDEMDPEDAGLPRSGLLEHLFSLPGKLFGK